ncbi:MBL fold metallo-hydrolase [Mariniluteicoccus endophyticus]
MRLTVLGCSGSTSGPGNPASSYLVTEGDHAVVLDMGPGSFGALWGAMDARGLDAILLSHLHPDHCLDLCAYNVAARHSPTAPWDRIPVYAPAHTPQRMDAAYRPDDVEVPTWAVDFVAWRPTQQVGPFTVRTAAVDHPTEAYAIRLDGPSGSLVYSGDTGPCDALVDLARGADTLLCEAAYLHRDDLPAGIHLSGRQAAEHASRAGVRRLVLTHVPPWHDPADVYAEARPHFAGELIVAEPGMMVEQEQ